MKTTTSKPGDPSHLSISSTDILAQIGEAVVATDWTNQVLFWNLAAERQYGVSAETILGQPLESAFRTEYLYGQDESSIRESLLQSGKWSGECVHILTDGRTLLVELDLYPLRDEINQHIGSIAIMHIPSDHRRREFNQISTNQRAREEADKQWIGLRDNGGVLESFLENLPGPAYVKDEQGRLIYFNEAAKKISPLMLAAKGRTDQELFGSEAGRQYREHDLSVLVSGKPIRILETVPSEDRERSYFSVKFPLFDSRGNRFVGGVSIDITDSIRDQAELRKQAALLDSANDAIFVSDLDGKITYWNQGAERLYGWSAQDAVGQNEATLLRAQFPLPRQEMLDILLRQGHWEGEVTRYDRHGQPHSVTSRWSLLRDLHGNPVARMVINTDLTEMRIAFDELRRAEAEAQARATELAAILDAMPAATFIAHDPECTTMSSSRAAYEILRLPVGSNTSLSAAPDEAPSNFRVFENGKELAPADLPVQRAASTGKPVYDTEITLAFEDGIDRRLFGSAVPLLDAQGSVRGAVGTFIDISHRHKSEEQLTLSQQRYRSLASVTDALCQAMQDESLSKSAREYLDIADRELARGAQVTMQNLEVHRQFSGATPAILSEIMEATLANFAFRLEALGIAVERDYRTRKSLICFTGDIRQVFAGLLSNSIDAMPNGGRLKVRIRAAQCPKTGELGLRVLVADSGKGIPSALRTRVFDPFISTKEAPGTGLGLWVAVCILRKHNGRIALRSSTQARHQGTVFSLFFPFKGVSE